MAVDLGLGQCFLLSDGGGSSPRGSRLPSSPQRRPLPNPICGFPDQGMGELVTAGENPGSYPALVHDRSSCRCRQSYRVVRHVGVVANGCDCIYSPHFTAQSVARDACCSLRRCWVNGLGWFGQGSLQMCQCAGPISDYLRERRCAVNMTRSATCIRALIREHE